MPKYLFVIDTDSYSGNFERPMCAYVTGAVGDCGVGEEYAEKFREAVGWESGEDWEDPSNPFIELIEWRLNDNDNTPCRRPVKIYPTPDMFNDGHGGHYSYDADPEMVREQYIKTIKEYEHFTDEDRERFIARGPGKYPCYQSVAIYLANFPTQEQIDLLKKRAEEFPELWKNDSLGSEIKITGFRVVEIIETENIVEV